MSAKRNRGEVKEIIRGLAAADARTKFGCAKALVLLSESDPALLYPEFEAFARLLKGENRVLKWNAIAIIGNLAAVDAGGRIEAMLARFLAPIRGPAMIDAANTMLAAASIAIAKPKLADRLAKAILDVERATYATAECRNIAIGHALVALGRFCDGIPSRKTVLAFAERQLANSRSGTRKKAERFLKAHGQADRAPAPVSGGSSPPRGRRRPRRSARCG